MPLPETNTTPEMPETDSPNDAGLAGDMSYDDFVAEMATDRGYSADTVINEESGLPEVDTSLSATTEQREPMSEKEAWDNTEVLFNLRETVQSYGLAWYVDGNFRAASKYDYEAEEKQRLIRAWSRVIGHYRIKVSPWVDVVLTEAVCTGPLIALAYNNRQQRIELEIQRAEIARLRNENATLRNDVAPASTRKDTKTQWKIDENGFFEYNEANTYIPKGKRKERPELTEENYALLCKHNGQEFVNEIFKIEK